MMRAGVPYNDWRRMAHFQRQDFLARYTIDAHKLGQRLAKAKNLGELVTVVIGRLLGLA